MDLIYINMKKTKIFDVNINFDTRKKGASKMDFKVLITLINMFIYKIYGKIFNKLS